MPGVVKYPVYDGDKFGMLTVQYIGKGPRGIVCRCDCGTLVETNRRSLALGLVQRCVRCRNVKLAEQWRKPDGHAAKTEIYNDYTYSARKRGIGWDLNHDQFYSLIDQKCRYCDRVPSTLKKTSRTKYGGYLYNGVDRKDPRSGYTIENVVPCCKTCNYMKGSLGEGEFLAQVRLIYTQTAR